MSSLLYGMSLWTRHWLWLCIGLTGVCGFAAMLWARQREQGAAMRRLLLAVGGWWLVAGAGAAAAVWVWPQWPWVTATIAGGLLLASALLWPLVLAVRHEPDKVEQRLRATVQELEKEVLARKRAQLELDRSRTLLRQLAAYQEQVKEDERKRIAREIHDELGQNLMALRIDVALLDARTGATHPLLNRKVRQVLRHIDNSIKAVRSIINNLRPSVLDLGLHAALEWQVQEFQRRTGILCRLLIEPGHPDADLDDHRATALFRVVQESLTNVARHAQASEVHLSLRRENGMLVMEVADNGVGIYPGCRRKPNSFGLLGIGERVSNLDGEFEVDSVPGEGTALKIRIPVQSQADQGQREPLTGVM